MIKEQELHEAIAECQGQRNPNAGTCMKLASYYTILDHITKREDVQVPSYSFAAPPPLVEYDSGTEFSDKIKGMDIKDVLAVVDELMTVLNALNPRLYNGVMRKLQ